MQNELSAIGQKIDAGAKAGVTAALEEHRRAGRSIVTLRDGVVVTIPPEEICVANDHAKVQPNSTNSDR
ncbi:MAG TPA: hypothetical protein VF719_13510 [Abditibacteriaceae bacterium]|jgi:hypothetical protein